MKNSYAKGQKDVRPWGIWEVIDAGEGFCVKRILVNPHCELSLQYHLFRSECWVIVQGTAMVELNKVTEEKHPGSVVQIPIEALHRIANRSDANLEFIEIQMGENLDEKDIKRLEDKYGRV